ncbi:NAD(P)-dependent oxidoreductase [Deinococcus irradiatisoli]|uniref:NAD(P)-dependent oxidoreductase n=1 Tax=Deinococcus irradiatisoli TaxID=2202254 RepID=A0A2Z3JH69_9DEIO|nr:NAD(P)-dependent oxidoreductase [Deinococcus irradiatisoli]AWN22710.1 NAD(P)-dependent oxidoreductase [Deinococcus irradiatisoli]
MSSDLIPRRVLLTGAAGHIGRTLRAGLRGHYELLRLTDVEAMDPPGRGEETVQADLTDPAAVREVMKDMDAVIHLGGIPDEDTYERIRRVNMDGMVYVMQAAHEAGVRRVAFASSIHAVGFAPRGPLGMNEPVRPDTFYGLSKVFGEALGRMYVDRYGLEFVAVRICSFLERPREARNLATWLSPRDAVQLFRRAIDAPGVGYLTVAGISDNTRRWMKPDGWDVLGYQPQDDAEAFASEIGHLKGDPDSHNERFQGGIFTEPGYRGRAGEKG